MDTAMGGRLRARLLMSSSAVLIAIAATPAVAQTSPSGASSAQQIEEVVVTARKREESLQSVPIAVTSVGGEALEQQGISDPNELERVVPSLRAGPSAASGNASVFSLRGQTPGDIGVTLSQPVGLYEDSVNIPHPAGVNAAFFDLSRVEVLKGPQGTLYGRNTTGGAINIITRNADHLGMHGFVNAEVGNYSSYKLGGAVNVPVIQDVLSARLAAQYWNREGYGKSRVTGQDLGRDHDDIVARLSVQFDPAPNLTSTTKLEYIHLDQNGQMLTIREFNPTASRAAPLAVAEAGLEIGNLAGGLAAIRNAITGDLFLSSAGTRNHSETTTWHFVEDVSWDIADAVTLRSVTGYHSVEDLYGADLDSTPYQILDKGVGLGSIQPITGPYPFPEVPDQRYEVWTQELNLSGQYFDGALDWLVGGFVSHEEADGGTPNAQVPRVLPNSVSVPSYIVEANADSWAFFTQNDVHFSDRVSMTFGARYTEERNKLKALQWSFNPVTQRFVCTSPPASSAAPIPPPLNNPNFCSVGGSQQASGTSYLLSFNFQATPTTLFYLKTAKGFRGGALQSRAPQFPPVGPEFATDYELGFKGDFFDRRLRTNVAIYQTNYDNKQVTRLDPGPPPTTILQNAATARIQGAEGEVNIRPLAGLSVYGSFTYLYGQYLDYPGALNAATGLPVLNGSGVNNAGGEPFNDPRWSYNLGARYDFDVGPGTLGMQLDWAWRGEGQVNAITFDPTISPALAAEFREARGLLNARVDYEMPDLDLTISLFATNLLDEHYQVAALGPSSFGYATGNTQEPRMWGVGIRKAFGDE